MRYGQLRTRNAKQVADFFCLANSQICKEVQRVGDWTGSIFTPGYTLIPVTDEAEAQESSLRYCMSQGTKEGLCPGPTSWPGIQSASALISGTMRLEGNSITRQFGILALRAGTETGHLRYRPALLSHFISGPAPQLSDSHRPNERREQRAALFRVRSCQACERCPQCMGRCVVV